MNKNVLAVRIKKLREESKITQLELSKVLSISNTTLSQYESGKRIPNDEIKLKIAKFFNVSMDYLLGNSDTAASATESVSHNELNINLNKIAPKIYELDRESLEELNKFINLLTIKQELERSSAGSEKSAASEKAFEN